MTGPRQTSKRSYYSSEQIELICTSELSSAELLPEEPGPIRIDRLLEKRFGITHEYEELPAEVLGYTRFGASGPEAVVINGSLDEEGKQASQRRARATLAHEVGHIMLHTELFTPVQDIQLKLIGTAHQEQSSTVCRGDLEMMLKQGTYKGDWWEYQANMVIGPLLMPRSLVAQALRNFISSTGRFGAARLDESQREQAIRVLSDIFDVNPIVARIRTGELYQTGGQLAI
jgi:hypothetical protein